MLSYFYHCARANYALYFLAFNEWWRSSRLVCAFMHVCLFVVNWRGKSKIEQVFCRPKLIYVLANAYNTQSLRYHCLCENKVIVSSIHNDLWNSAACWSAVQLGQVQTDSERHIATALCQSSGFCQGRHVITVWWSHSHEVLVEIQVRGTVLDSRPLPLTILSLLVSRPLL